MDNHISQDISTVRETGKSMFVWQDQWLGFAAVAALLTLLSTLACVFVFIQLRFPGDPLAWQLDQPGADAAFRNLQTLLGFIFALLLVAGCSSFLLCLAASNTPREPNHRLIPVRPHAIDGAFRLLADISPQIAWASSPNGAFTYCNQHWFDLTGMTQAETEGYGWMQAIDPDCLDQAKKVWFDARRKGIPFEVEILFRRGADGWYRWHLVRSTPLKDNTGRIIMWLGVASDIHENREVHELEAYRKQLEETNLQLESLATTDGLTQLHNRHAFQEKLTEEVKRTHRYASPLSLLLLDVDHFKEYNDSYGHPAGDEALRVMSRVLEKSIRATDFVARYGGEEFAILMPGTDLRGAAASAEKIRKAVEGNPWSKSKITVSIGVASTDSETDDGSALIEEADGALYLSKKDGRNCVSVAGNKGITDYFQRETLEGREA